MDRCELAVQYHHSGYNCAQSVLAAFEDLTHMDETTAFAVSGGLGGASGAVMVLGLLHPFTDGADAAGKRRVYGQAKEFLHRFQARFDGLSRCGDLLAARIEPTEEATPAALRLGVDKHCDILIVTAVEVVEEMLAEEKPV